MDEETVRCPICKGLKCMPVMNINPFTITESFICSYFDHKNCFRTVCTHMCSFCKGTGHVSWIDQFFQLGCDKLIRDFQLAFSALKEENIIKRSKLKDPNKARIKRIEKIIKNINKDE